MTDKLPPVPELLLCSLPWSMRDHVEQWMTDYARQAVREAVPEGFVLVSKEIIDRFPEINASNYDHDDACNLNAWGVELVLSIAAAKEAK